MSTHEVTQVVRFGAGISTDAELRIVGEVDGRRILELGAGIRSGAIAFAQKGAHVMVVEPDPEALSAARLEAEEAGVRVEWHQGDVADLAFLRGDSVDMAFSVDTLATVDDIGRVFRQVHRVMKHGSPFVFAYEHPMAFCLRTAAEPGTSPRSYFDTTPVTVQDEAGASKRHPRTISDVFTALTRSGFRVELIAEPEPIVGSSLVPPVIIWRARKEGA